MEHLLHEIDTASSRGLHYIALMLAMAVPDQCAALASEDGETCGQRYREWYQENMLGGYLDYAMPMREPGDPDDVWLSAWDCYKFRCSMLHQGRTDHHQATSKRIAFVEPGQGIHKVMLSQQLIVLDAKKFAGDMTRSARAWLRSVAGTEPFDRNQARFIQRRPQGLPGLISAPVIS
jgi:hypothetical protein